MCKHCCTYWEIYSSVWIESLGAPCTRAVTGFVAPPPAHRICPGQQHAPGDLLAVAYVVVPGRLMSAYARTAAMLGTLSKHCNTNGSVPECVVIMAYRMP